jgi:hypothetical protein
VRARLTAVLTAIVVFPSPGIAEVTSSDFKFLPPSASSTDVRNCRKASAIGAGASPSSSRPWRARAPL